MHGDLKYGPDAKHFEYVNPDAPKGGEIRAGDASAPSTLSTPSSSRATRRPASACSTRRCRSSPTTRRSANTACSPRRSRRPKDRSWVAFTLRKEARWQRRQADHRRRRDLHAQHPAREGPAVLSLLLRQRRQGGEDLRARGEVHLQGRDQSRTAADPGPDDGAAQALLGRQRIRPHDAGAARLPPVPTASRASSPAASSPTSGSKDWWGKDLWINIGRFNFDEIRYDYFRDFTVVLEAFKSRPDRFPLREHRAQLGDGLRHSRRAATAMIKKEEIKHEIPQGMQAFVMNLRRPHIPGPPRAHGAGADVRLRMDEQDAVLQCHTRAASPISAIPNWPRRACPRPEELEILEPLRGKIPDEVFTTEFKLPVTDGSGNNRNGQREALRLFKEAGWEIEGRQAGRTRAARHSPSRSCWPTRPSNALRCPSSRRWTASASMSACAPSIPRSSSAAPIRSTST